MSWTQLRQSLGWHTGQGAVREIGAGALGYIAGLPIVVLGGLITFIVSKIGHANPTHPISQEFTGPMSAGKIIGLLFTLSIFAPILEETMFRGALYFHLRRRWRPWLSAILVSLAFAAIHPQGWAGIPVLASIAIVLALLREWRGTLLASITAHGINNGIVLLVMVLMLR
jgi:membrane protease YdiL (CAAX protease family)